MTGIGWNPWHGCHKISEGCRHCYVYRQDAAHDKDASVVTKNGDFDLPLRKKRSGEYKIAPGTVVNTCFTSDFLVDEADLWRAEAWQMMQQRQDLKFFFITKRIHRLAAVLPPDWGSGYDNVCIGCTVENQEMADYRLPIFQQAPVKHKILICEPLLSAIDLKKYLGEWLEEVSVGGESGTEARVCDYDWVLDIRRQCADSGIPFSFHQTGARLKKGGRIYRILRKYQHQQAKKAGINHRGSL